MHRRTTPLLYPQEGVETMGSGHRRCDTSEGTHFHRSSPEGSTRWGKGDTVPPASHIVVPLTAHSVAAIHHVAWYDVFTGSRPPAPSTYNHTDAGRW